MDHVNQIIELFVGYSHLEKGKNEMKANSTVTLVKGKNKTILFDTLTAWDGEILLKKLKYHHILPEQINYLVCSHGHADHIGNLNLFLHAYHFVGACLSHKNIYFCHDFEKEPYVLDEDIEVIATPGHTNTCISLIVRNSSLENNAAVAIVGDLFEKEGCIFNESLWINAGTENEKQQRKNRLKVAEMAQFIVPGHGPMFEVTEEMREKLRKDARYA